MSHPFARLTAEQRDELVEEPLPDWLDPMLATLTDDGRLRHPRYLGLREGKEAQDVVRETPD